MFSPISSPRPSRAVASAFSVLDRSAGFTARSIGYRSLSKVSTSAGTFACLITSPSEIGLVTSPVGTCRSTYFCPNNVFGTTSPATSAGILSTLSGSRSRLISAPSPSDAKSIESTEPTSTPRIFTSPPSDSCNPELGATMETSTVSRKVLLNTPHVTQTRNSITTMKAMPSTRMVEVRSSTGVRAIALPRQSYGRRRAPDRHRQEQIDHVDGNDGRTYGVSHGDADTGRAAGRVVAVEAVDHDHHDGEYEYLEERPQHVAGR